MVVFPPDVSWPSDPVKTAPPSISGGFLMAFKTKSNLRGVSPEPIGVCDTLGTFTALDPINGTGSRNMELSEPLSRVNRVQSA